MGEVVNDAELAYAGRLLALSRTILIRAEIACYEAEERAEVARRRYERTKARYDMLAAEATDRWQNEGGR